MDYDYTFAVIVPDKSHFNRWRTDSKLKIGAFKNGHLIINGIRYICITVPDQLRGWRIDGIIETDCAKDNRYYGKIMNVIDVNFIVR